MRVPRLRSSPSIFHPSTNRRMYKFASNGEMGTLRDAAPFIPGFRRACLPSSIVGFFHGAQNSCGLLKREPMARQCYASHKRNGRRVSSAASKPSSHA